MTNRVRSRVFLSPALRTLCGFLLLLLCACSVGIDDRPVPPEAIPNVAFQQPSADYGAPAPSAEPAVMAAAPAYPRGSGSGEAMVWQTGAQPVVQGSSLSAPDELSAGTQAGEEPVGIEEPASAPEQAEPVAPEQSGDAEAASAPVQMHSFRLAPFVGLEADAAAPLREALQAEAEQNGFDLAGGKDAPVLKGYLSSMEDDGATVLIYVWDIYDAAGNRLTRIDGQQKLPAGSRTEPLALDRGAAEKLAARTIAALARWRPDGAV